MKRSLHYFVASAAVLVAATFGIAAESAAQASSKSPPVKTAKAIFAGGCFWCMEQPFDTLPGVISTISGYIGGAKHKPNYNEVSAGITGHTEAVQIEYDPTRVSFEKLLHVFWRNIDPTVRNRQFCDSGTQYRTGIFYLDETQRKAAFDSKAALDTVRPFKAEIVTEITRATEFYPAEEYHQDYYQKNPIRYKFYRNNCGRDARLKELWGAEAGGASKK